MNKNNKQLLAYSAMALGFINMRSEATAQAIYTDINPDTILLPLKDWFYTEEDKLYLDIDQNDDNDFKFLNLSYYHDDFYSFSDEFRQRLWFGRADLIEYDERNFIAGSYTTGWTPSGYVHIVYPYAFHKNITIDNEWNWEDGRYQRIACRTYEYHTADTAVITYEGGNWYPTTKDKYLGIKFVAEDELTHFGWIRCSVIDKHERGFVIIIKDYAYELTPNAPIMAGDTIGGLPAPIDTTISLNETLNNFISVYSFNNTVIINTTETFGNELLISVFDITGNKIIKTTSNLKHTALIVDVPEGIYVVEIKSEENKFNKKVYLH